MMVKLSFLCMMISWTTIAESSKPTTYLNQTLLVQKTKQEGTTDTTTTTTIPGHDSKHHNQTIPKSKYDGGPSWLLNVPLGWGAAHHATHSLQRHENYSADINYGTTFLQRFDALIEHAFDDGEAVDAIEHFFWGRTNGLVMELGAGDGLPATASVSYSLEKQLGWRRILVEGNPKFQEILRTKSTEALTVVREEHSLLLSTNLLSTCFRTCLSI